MKILSFEYTQVLQKKNETPYIKSIIGFICSYKNILQDTGEPNFIHCESSTISDIQISDYTDY